MEIQSFLWSHMNFRIVCSSSLKNAGGILIGIALIVWIALGSRDFCFLRFIYLFWREREGDGAREQSRWAEGEVEGEKQIPH